MANPGIGRLSVLICGLMFLLIPVRIPYVPLRTSIWNKTLFMRIATNQFFFVSMEILSSLNPARTICPFKDGYVEPSHSGTTFTRLNLSWTLLSMGINYRFFKFLRPSQLKIIVRLWSGQLSSKVLSTISLSTVASLKCLRLLLSSTLCPYLFKNQAKSV